VNDAVDPAAVKAARTLRRLLLSRKEDREAVAEAVDMLCAALLRRLGGWVDPATGWLTPTRLALVERFVVERMGERISVADIAAALGLSANFLTLAFKGALGMTPHRWLTEYRLACARVELAGTAKAVAVIAAECGFADQAHLTRHMRAALGVTPAAYRRLRRG
jgi:AraC-like DNA-binding protein